MAKKKEQNIDIDDEDENADLVVLPGNGEYALEVVGESHYQYNLMKIAGVIPPGGLRIDAEARLIMENDNPHDENAVRVEIEGEKVGYLSREVAPWYRQELIKGNHPEGIGIVDAQIRGWKDKFGVWLDIPVQVVESSTVATKTNNNNPILIVIVLGGIIVCSLILNMLGR